MFLFRNKHLWKTHCRYRPVSPYRLLYLSYRKYHRSATTAAIVIYVQIFMLYKFILSNSII